MWSVQREVLSLISLVIVLGPLLWLWRRWETEDQAISQDWQRLYPHELPYRVSTEERTKRWIIGICVFGLSLLVGGLIYPGR